jgi:hypothetical protein
MRDQEIIALPVVRRGRVLGMFTASDDIRLRRVPEEGVLSKPEPWRVRADGKGARRGHDCP